MPYVIEVLLITNTTRRVLCLNDIQMPSSWHFNELEGENLPASAMIFDTFDNAVSMMTVVQKETLQSSDRYYYRIVAITNAVWELSYRKKDGSDVSVTLHSYPDIATYLVTNGEKMETDTINQTTGEWRVL